MFAMTARPVCTTPPLTPSAYSSSTASGEYVTTPQQLPSSAVFKEAVSCLKVLPGLHEQDQQQDAAYHKPLRVYAMLPLDTVNADFAVFKLATSNWFGQALQLLAASGAQGVAVDVWWGAVERTPRNYNWTGYKHLFEVVKQAGLKLQVVMSFHACGGNVGDTTHITLPTWVLQCGDQDPDLFYTDKPRDGGRGHRNREYVSIWASDARVLCGRTAYQCYEEFMTSFRDTFAQDLGTVIEEVVVGAGPCGELRYPSYPASSGWRFPGIGEFQCYDCRALASLAQAAKDAGHPEWGYGGPHDAGHYNSKPEETGFFSHAGSWDTAYGRFFMEWYSGCLTRHGDRLLQIATRIFHNAYSSDLSGRLSQQSCGGGGSGGSAPDSGSCVTTSTGIMVMGSEPAGSTTGSFTMGRKVELMQQAAQQQQQQQQMVTSPQGTYHRAALGSGGTAGLGQQRVQNGRSSPSSGNSVVLPWVMPTNAAAGTSSPMFSSSAVVTAVPGSSSSTLPVHTTTIIDASDVQTWGPLPADAAMELEGWDAGAAAAAAAAAQQQHQQQHHHQQQQSRLQLPSRPGSSKALNALLGGDSGQGMAPSSSIGGSGTRLSNGQLGGSRLGLLSMSGNDVGTLNISWAPSMTLVGAGNSFSSTPSTSAAVPASAAVSCPTTSSQVPVPHFSSCATFVAADANNSTLHAHHAASAPLNAHSSNHHHHYRQQQGAAAAGSAGSQQQRQRPPRTSIILCHSVGSLAATDGGAGPPTPGNNSMLPSAYTLPYATAADSNMLMRDVCGSGSVGSDTDGSCRTPDTDTLAEEDSTIPFSSSIDEDRPPGSAAAIAAAMRASPLLVSSLQQGEPTAMLLGTPAALTAPQLQLPPCMAGSPSGSAQELSSEWEEVKQRGSAELMGAGSAACGGGGGDGGMGSAGSAAGAAGSNGLQASGSVAPVMPTVSLKIPGVHWWYRTRSHAAELTAGYYNTATHDGYAGIVALCARYGASLILTCVEMCDAQHPLQAACSPEGLLKHLRALTARHGVQLSGENALPILLVDGADTVALDRIVYNTRSWYGPHTPADAVRQHVLSQQQQHRRQQVTSAGTNPSYPPSPLSATAAGWGAYCAGIGVGSSSMHCSLSSTLPIGRSLSDAGRLPLPYASLSHCGNGMHASLPRAGGVQSRSYTASSASQLGLPGEHQGLVACGLRVDSYADITEPLPAMRSFTFLRLGPELLLPQCLTPWLRFMGCMQQGGYAAC